MIPKHERSETGLHVSTSFQENTLMDERIYKANQKYKNLWQNAYHKIKSEHRIARLRAFHFFPECKYTRNLNWPMPLTKKEGTEEFSDHHPFHIIHPRGKLYTLWLSIMGLILLYIAICDPFISAFYNNAETKTGLIGEMMIDFSFIIDLFINFNLAYINEDGLLISKRKAIAINYLKGWFILDIFSSVPLSLITYLEGTQSKSSNLLKLLRLRNVPKLLRVGKLLNMLKKLLFVDDIEYLLNKFHKTFRFFKIMITVFVSIHIMACLFYLAAKSYDFSPETWVYKANLVNRPVGISYLNSVYWTITTLTTIGYGDITPFTWIEKLLAMLWMVIGVYILSFSVGSLSSFYSELNLNSSTNDQKVLLAEDFARKVYLPTKLRYLMKRKIRLTKFHPKHELSFLFSGINLELRLEIAKNIFHKAIEKIPFFSQTSDAFVADIALRLEPVVFETSSCIWRENEPANEILFITVGEVQLSYKDMVFIKLRAGHYLGDIEIVYGTEREFSAEALGPVRVLKLSKDTLKRIQEKYVKEWDTIKVHAKTRAINLIENLAEMIVIKNLEEKHKISQVRLEKYKEKVKRVAETLYSRMKIFKKTVLKKKLKSKLKESDESLKRLKYIVGELEYLEYKDQHTK